MASKRKWQGDWHGRESTQWTGSIKELQKKIPTFTREDFRIKKGINKYKDLIVREPFSEITEDLGYVEAINSERIPIEAVSNNYTRRTFRGRKQGYKLVQHHDVLENILAGLDEFARRPVITHIESLEATLLLSIYGARMHIEFLVPHYKRGTYTLKVTCRNSVDRSMALTINLSLHLGAETRGIPFDGFYHVHTQELKDRAIKDFLSNALRKFTHGTWDTDDVDRDNVEEIIDDFLNSKERQRVRNILDEEEETDRVNLLRFREILALLIDEGKKQFQDQMFVKFAKLAGKLNDLADETEYS